MPTKQRKIGASQKNSKSKNNNSKTNKNINNNKSNNISKNSGNAERKKRPNKSQIKGPDVKRKNKDGNNKKVVIASTDPIEQPSDQACSWSSWSVFFVVFAIYTRTVYPSITGGDSGELVVTACNLGTAHPPGYPTFTMLGWLIQHIIPFGTKAWRLNMLSVLCGSGCAAFVHSTVTKLTGNIWPGILSAFGFAFTPTVWTYSLQGEVFALNNLLCSMMAYVLVIFYQKSSASWEAERAYLSAKRNMERSEQQNNTGNSGNENENEVDVDSKIADEYSQAVGTRSNARLEVLRSAYLGALVCGIAMTNQHTTIFYVIPTVLFVLSTLILSKQLTGKTVLMLSICLFGGMLPYIFLPISSAFKRMDSWGNQATLEGFLHHFLRREYGTFQLAASEISQDPGMLSRLLMYWKILLGESLYITPLLGFVGIISMLLHKSRTIKLVGWILLSSLTMYIVIFHKLANLSLKPLFLGVQARFWMQPNLYIFICAGVGTFSIVNFITNELALSKTSSRRILAALVVLFAVVQIGSHFNKHDFASFDGFHRQGDHILESFPKRSLVLLNGDLNNNLLKYPQQCEGKRPDLNLVSLQLMTWDWFVPQQAHHYRGVKFPGSRYHPFIEGAFSIKQFLDANYRKFGKRIFLCGSWKDGDGTYNGFYKTEFYGMCNKITRVGAPPLDPYDQLNDSFKQIPYSVDHIGEFKPDQHTEETWEVVLFRDAANRFVTLASHASYFYNHHPNNAKLQDLALEIQDALFSDKFVLPDSIRPVDYRAAGIVYALYAKKLEREGDPILLEQTIEKAYSAWYHYVMESDFDGTYDEQQWEEIANVMIAHMNPYSGRSFPQHLIDQDIKSKVEHARAKRKEQRTELERKQLEDQQIREAEQRIYAEQLRQQQQQQHHMGEQQRHIEKKQKKKRRKRKSKS